MRILFHIILALSFALPVTSCANKGKLKSPSQIALEEQKKERKKAKTEQDKAEAPAAEQPAAAEEPLGAPKQGSK
jgi:hypothetical protein